MTEKPVVELTIEDLGAAGDGLASHEGRRYFVADCLPGDVVQARVTGQRGDGFAAETVVRLKQGPHRQAPACRHFNDCGGCAVQHLDDDYYNTWKRGLLVTALARRGLDDVDVAPLMRIPPGARRRATVHVLRRKHDVVLGFQARGSHRIVALEECPVLTPDLAGLLAPLREMFHDLLKSGARVEALITAAASGVDLLIRAKNDPSLGQSQRLIEFANSHDLARVSWRASGDDGAELIVHRRAVAMEFGGVAVELPPGSFLQASAAGEAALAAIVCEATGAAKQVADLYAGCGALSFPMAGHARVHAVEGSAAMTAAIEAAAARVGLTGRLTSEARDLERRPLTAKELKRFDAVVFDPPRAGAKQQAETLASSVVPLVVALSCNPASFARDARILIDGGYVMEQVRPIDQFLWSAHIEVSAVFRRK